MLVCSTKWRHFGGESLGCVFVDFWTKARENGNESFTIDRTKWEELNWTQNSSLHSVLQSFIRSFFSSFRTSNLWKLLMHASITTSIYYKLAMYSLANIFFTTFVSSLRFFSRMSVLFVVSQAPALFAVAISVLLLCTSLEFPYYNLLLWVAVIICCFYTMFANIRIIWNARDAICSRFVCLFCQIYPFCHFSLSLSCIRLFQWCDEMG